MPPVPSSWHYPRRPPRGLGRFGTLLLGREEVNPYRADTEYGRTPLSWAARRGHKRIIKMLLELEGINLDQTDSECGQTSPPLFDRQLVECEVHMQCRPLNPNTDTIDLNGEPGPHHPTPMSRNQYRISRIPSQCPWITTPPQPNGLFSPNPPRGPSGSPILYGNPTPTTRIPAKLC